MWPEMPKSWFIEAAALARLSLYIFIVLYNLNWVIFVTLFQHDGTLKVALPCGGQAAARLRAPAFRPGGPPAALPRSESAPAAFQVS